ncbi:MAG: DUF6249 domain-containing protein [Opitutaceae bacterium]|nr:DUF6249 domain-containing protein [Opitutaceae bacterium]
MQSFAPAFANLQVITLLIPALAILMGPAIVFIVFRAKRERERLWHETARIAIEKGQPLPPMPADLSGANEVNISSLINQSRVRTPFRDLRAGLLLGGLGAGLFLGIPDDFTFFRVCSFILMGLGAARILSGIIGSFLRKDSSTE